MGILHGPFPVFIAICSTIVLNLDQFALIPANTKKLTQLVWKLNFELTCAICQFTAPLDILEEIFLHLPPNEVVSVCRLVCHEWKDVADSESLWRERCRRERYNVRDPSKTPTDWRLFYFLCKRRRNLLKNPRAESKKHQKLLNFSVIKVMT